MVNTGLDADGMPLSPGKTFLLGTDSLGRDILARVVHGTRIPGGLLRKHLPMQRRLVHGDELEVRREAGDLEHRSNDRIRAEPDTHHVSLALRMAMCALSASPG